MTAALKRVRLSMTRADPGVGTMMGIGLVALVGVLIGAVGVAGQVMYFSSRAETGAQVAALSGAGVLNGLVPGASPCSMAAEVANKNEATVTSCAVHGQDVQVEVDVTTGIPLAPHLNAVSRAGPEECGEGG